MEIKPNLSNYSIDVVTWLAFDERKRKFTGLTMDQVLEDICLVFDQSPVMVKSKSRKREYLYCRYIASYVIHSLIGKTVETISDFIGGKDHSTILASNKNVRQWIKEKDPIFYYEYWLKYTECSEIWNRYNKLPLGSPKVKK